MAKDDRKRMFANYLAALYNGRAGQALANPCLVLPPDRGFLDQLSSLHI